MNKNVTQTGCLYLCATPIGNLQDITLRVLETLKTVDLIACEDTRNTLKLLNHFDISKPVTSYYEHNKEVKGDKLIQALLEGKSVALVSDAGMPGISDPGYDLVQLCLQEHIPFTVLPGAVAAINALVLSGLPTTRFAFEGFIPRHKKERRALFTSLSQETRTMIFYESPHRLLQTLEDMNTIWGNRKIAVARELTKKFEEVTRGTAEEVLAYFEEKGVKGEFVIIVDGAAPIIEEAKDLEWAMNRIEELVSEGTNSKDAIKQAAKEGDLNKREVYGAWVSLKNS